MTRGAKAFLLLFFFSLCAAAFVLAHRFQQHVPAPVPHELFAVVNDQLAAFRSDDYPGAYRRAATGVQQKFTLPQFEAMVRRNYGAITRADRVEFGSVKSDGANAVVQVFFFGPGGSARCFLYSLTSEGDGWKVEGVEEVAPFAPDSALFRGAHA